MEMSDVAWSRMQIAKALNVNIVDKVSGNKWNKWKLTMTNPGEYYEKDMMNKIEQCFYDEYSK